MKRKFLFGAFALVAMSLMSSTCSNDDDGNNQSSDLNDLQQITQTGNWTITKYIDSGDDELYHFEGYVFNFKTDGSLEAVKGDTTVVGTWSITNDSNSSDDDDNNSSDDVDFNIFFATPSNFADLSDDWDIISITDNKIELIDISGGNGGTDYLTFDKN